MKIPPSSGAVFWMFPVFTQKLWPPQRTRDPTNTHGITWSRKRERPLSLAMLLFRILKSDTLGKDLFHLVVGFSFVFSPLVLHHVSPQSLAWTARALGMAVPGVPKLPRWKQWEAVPGMAATVNTVIAMVYTFPSNDMAPDKILFWNLALKNILVPF